MAEPTFVVDVDDVRTRLSLPDMPEIADAIQKGLVSANVFFEATLSTSFAEKLQQSDVFLTDSDLMPTLPNGQYRLRLKNAFVKPDTISIRYGLTRITALDPAQAVSLPSTDFVLDADKGLVYLDGKASADGTSYADKYVVVTYDSGFGETTGTVAPDWLKEAFMAYMPGVLITKGEDVADQMQVALNIRQQALEMVNRYKRESAFNFSPIY